MINRIIPGTNLGTGWLPPMPDLRDYTPDTPQIREISKKIFTINKLPDRVDSRQWCSPVENQFSLGSCTAHAGIGLIEYYENHAYGKHLEGSRLFLYKVTRNLMQVKGDTGAWLRNVAGALTLFGVLDEKYLPYSLDGKVVNPNWDAEPSAFDYALANNYKAYYFSYNFNGALTTGEEILEYLKYYLANGVPAMFGFYGFPSYQSSDVLGGIPYPGSRESSAWGHAVMAVGYDDTKVIKNTKYGNTTTGALLIRNSWGASWGDKGYGWLPYDYVMNKLAMDFWSLISMEWIDSGQFGL